ncbi:universal stress protein [Streptomyces pilosus]|uniref:Universal stress protein A n=1 Tax=Streptomyces pilosus TaxID=28893 RepID=A0A918ET64_9ACTN|nr:universal stress protein [Streptomyces pilosus]GGQ67885.1 universal stress protein A [Streptomyces pilosus]GGV53755.1 universal stress protein A [Streptomyces pilosus]
MTEQQSSRFERGTDGPKVIVAGVDGSDSSLRAAASATGLARRQGTLLAPVYVQRVAAAGVALGAPVAAATEEVAEDLVARIREARFAGSVAVRLVKAGRRPVTVVP